MRYLAFVHLALNVAKMGEILVTISRPKRVEPKLVLSRQPVMPGVLLDLRFTGRNAQQRTLLLPRLAADSGLAGNPGDAGRPTAPLGGVLNMRDGQTPETKSLFIVALSIIMLL